MSGGVVVCPRCGCEVLEDDRRYFCRCLTVWKEKGGRRIGREEAGDLFARGRTAVLDGFTDRKGRRFSAALRVEGGGVVFARSGGGKDLTGSVVVSVRAASSGGALLSVDAPFNRAWNIGFGPVSSALAECYAAITGVKYVRHRCRGASGVHVSLVVSAHRLARYLLGERRPRSADAREAVSYLRALLREFASWAVSHRPAKGPRLQGGSLARFFPDGVFPWLQAEVRQVPGGVVVKLPDDPAVAAQFRASVYRAVGEGGVYSVPAAAKGVFWKWLYAVRGEVGGRRK